jgi:hypothetical protein
MVMVKGAILNALIIFFACMYIFIYIFGASLDQAFQYSLILDVASGALKNLPF